jgi:hypothetical protein
MNGPHDLGGQMGFGPVAPETDEPVFHADWERRALGVTLASGTLGAWTIDESRHARESLHPATYYSRATTRSGSGRWKNCLSAMASSPLTSLRPATRSGPA